MPNLIMASAFAMLFFALFSDNGPVNAVLLSMGWILSLIHIFLLISICRFAAAVPWVLIGIRSPVKRPVVTPMQILATPVPFNGWVDS